MSMIDILFAASPVPPVQAPVGHAPLKFLDRLPDSQYHIQSLEPLGLLLDQPLTRGQVREIARNANVTTLAKYACIMAWGGQRYGNFDQSIAAAGLPRLLQSLCDSNNHRRNDFKIAQLACQQIPGLGISFYTKLLFFLRPSPDAYILDRWTAKSSCLLTWPPVVRLGPIQRRGFVQAAVNTTPQEYEEFCLTLEHLSKQLWDQQYDSTGADLEAALFDRNMPDGFWRRFVRLHFTNHAPALMIRGGAHPITSALDYALGMIVLKLANPPEIRVFQINANPMAQAGEFLRARLREMVLEHELPVILTPLNDMHEAQMDQGLIELNLGVAARGPEPDFQIDEEIEDEDSETMPLQNNSKAIYLSDANSKTGQQHQWAIRIMNDPDWRTPKNLGAICLKHHCLDLKSNDRSPRYLIEELGGVQAFQKAGPICRVHGICPDGDRPDGKTCCWSGSGYEAGVHFDSIEDAVRYLKGHFDVRVCDGNFQVTQEWIDGC